MVRVEWHADAVEDLIKHDSWRRSHGWEPIGADLMDAVAVAGARDDTYPWQRLKGEIVVDKWARPSGEGGRAF